MIAKKQYCESLAGAGGRGHNTDRGERRGDSGKGRVLEALLIRMTAPCSYLMSAPFCCVALSGGLIALRPLPQPQHPSRLPLPFPFGGVRGALVCSCPVAAGASPQ